MYCKHAWMQDVKQVVYLEWPYTCMTPSSQTVLFLFFVGGEKGSGYIRDFSNYMIPHLLLAALLS